MEVDKSALRNVVRHTDTHNRVKEMDEMWKQHEKEKYSDQERDRESKRQHRSRKSSKSRLYSDTIDDERTTKSSKSGPWTKKLLEYEEQDSDRWGHSGYKELYPEDFDDSEEPAVTIEKEAAVAEEEKVLKDEDIVERWKKGRFRPQVDSRRPIRGFDKTRQRFGWRREKFSGPSHRNVLEDRPQEGRVDRTRKERQRSRSQENYRARLPGRFDRRRSRSESRERQQLKGRERKTEKTEIDSRDVKQRKNNQRDRSGERHDESEISNVESKKSTSFDTSLRNQDRRSDEGRRDAPKGRWDQKGRSIEEGREVVKDIPDVKARKGPSKAPNELVQVESVAKEIRGRWERDESSDEEEGGKEEFVEGGMVDMFGRDISKRYDYKLKQKQVGARDNTFHASRERLANDGRRNEVRQKDEDILESGKSGLDDTAGKLEDGNAEEEAMEEDDSRKDRDSSDVENRVPRRASEKKRKHGSKEKKRKAKRSKSRERADRSDADDLLVENSKDKSRKLDVPFEYSRERNTQIKAISTEDLSKESEMRERIKLKMKQRMEGTLVKKNILGYDEGSDDRDSDQEGFGEKAIENSHFAEKWRDSDDHTDNIRVEDGAGFGRSEKQISETVPKRERRGRKSREDSSSTLEDRKGGRRNSRGDIEGGTGDLYDDTMASKGDRRGRSRTDRYGRSTEKTGRFKKNTRHGSTSYSSAEGEKEVGNGKKVRSTSARGSRKASYSSDDRDKAGKRKKKKARGRSDSVDSMKKEARNKSHRSRGKSRSESSSERMASSEKFAKAKYKNKGQYGKGRALEAKASRVSIERTGRSEGNRSHKAKGNRHYRPGDSEEEIRTEEKTSRKMGFKMDSTNKKKRREVHVRGSDPNLSSNSSDDSYSTDDERIVSDRIRHRGFSVQEREFKRRPGRKNSDLSSENEDDKTRRRQAKGGTKSHYYEKVKKSASDESDSSSSENVKDLPNVEYKRKSKKNDEDSSFEDEKREEYNRQKRSERQINRPRDNVSSTNGKRSDRKRDDRHSRKRGRESSEDDRRAKEKSRRKKSRSSSSYDEYKMKKSEKKQKGRLKEKNERRRRRHSVSSSEESEDGRKKEVYERHAKYEKQVGEKSTYRVGADVAERASEDEKKLEEENRKIISERLIGKSTAFKDTDPRSREETHREISSGKVEEKQAALIASAAGNVQDSSHFEVVAGKEATAALGTDSSSDYSLYGDIDLKTVASHTDKAKRSKSSPHREVKRITPSRESRSPFDGASRIYDKTEKKRDGSKPRYSRGNRSLSREAKSKKEEHRRRTKSRDSRSSDGYSDREEKRSHKRTARKQSPKSYSQSRKHRSLSRDRSEDRKRWEKSQHRSGGKSHVRRNSPSSSSDSSVSESDGYHGRRKRGLGSKRRGARLRSRSPQRSSSSSYSSSAEEARRKDKSVSRKRDRRSRRSTSSDESRSSVSSIDKRKRRRK